MEEWNAVLECDSMSGADSFASSKESVVPPKGLRRCSLFQYSAISVSYCLIRSLNLHFGGDLMRPIMAHNGAYRN
jgi:hypothetical protein